MSAHLGEAAGAMIALPHDGSIKKFWMYLSREATGAMNASLYDGVRGGSAAARRVFPDCPSLELIRCGWLTVVAGLRQAVCQRESGRSSPIGRRNRRRWSGYRRPCGGIGPIRCRVQGLIARRPRAYRRS